MRYKQRVCLRVVFLLFHFLSTKKIRLHLVVWLRKGSFSYYEIFQ